MNRFRMISFNRKVALGIGSASMLLAALAAPLAWWVARENAEEAIVAMAVEESERLLQHEPFRPQGPQAQEHAQAATRALVGGLFDIAELYAIDGQKLAEAATPSGATLEQDLPTHRIPGYTEPYYESWQLAPDRWALRVFVPLRLGAQQTISGYFEGVRLVPRWQREQIRNDALKVALMVALAALVCGAALYPVVIRLFTENQRQARELLESHITMMEAMGRAIARCDSDTGTHNYRVAWMAASLGEAVGLHGPRMQALIAGSFLHDVGKIGIPDDILLKPGRLNEHEMAIMRTHVTMGEEIVIGAGWLEGGREVVAGHHEKWDGSGYPRGLAGEDIPLVARIFAIVDVFDALCARRPYKPPMDLAAALEVLTDGAGRHFDPHLLKVFMGLAPQFHQIIIKADEAHARTLLEQMVHKHFGL